MSFIIRVGFWLGIVILLLPTGTPQQAGRGEAASFGAVDALSAAGAAVADIGQFCTRQPEACEVGSKAATAFGQKAQASVKWLYDVLTEQFGPAGDGIERPGVGLTQPRPGVRQPPSQNTLTHDDRALPWRGPPQPTRLAGS